MTKTTVTITLDVEVIERLRNSNINVSKTCNEYLASYFVKIKRKADLQKEIQTKESELAVIKSKLASERIKDTKLKEKQLSNKLKQEIKALQALYKQKENGSIFAKEEFKKKLDFVCQEFNLELSDVVRKISG